MKESEIKHAIEKIGWAFVGIKDLLLRRNDILLWQLEDIANKAENAYNHVTVLCDYMIDDGEIDVTEALENIRIEATKILTNKYGDVPDCIPETNERDPFYNRIFFNVGSIIWEISSYWDYVEKRKQEQETETPPLHHLTTILTMKQATQLLIELKQKGYVSETTINDNWIAAFGFIPFPENYSRIIWIKKTLPNRQPNKRSLLFLLDLIGCKENDVREHINQLFVVQDARTDFNDKNDFNEFYSPQDSIRAALRNKNSQFASDLDNIIDKILHPQDS